MFAVWGLLTLGEASIVTSASLARGLRVGGAGSKRHDKQVHRLAWLLQVGGWQGPRPMVLSVECLVYNDTPYPSDASRSVEIWG